MERIVIIGSSISGGLAACYLKLRFPDCEVVSIQKHRATFPVVGESLTEFSTLMLHEIGLGSYLEERHFHKYGLTFYFKENIENPSDNTYAIHEAPRIPPLPSNQINRFTLAKRLRDRALELNVRTIDATVIDVTINAKGPHQLIYALDDGGQVTLDAAWIVDASGRNRFLAKRLGLTRRPRFQRSSFWFRLEGFDKDVLKQLTGVKAPHHCFDSYYVTHHFLGQHNWLWAIPMRSDRADCNLISIGIVYRPDLYPKEVISIETFLSQVGAEHPIIAELVKSGRIVDVNVYRNYFYETALNYSDSGWFIIGDAGDTVDPLYSTGMAMTSIQIKQVAALIDAGRRGTLTEEYVNDLQQVYKKLRDSLQYEISTLYEVMHDPFQAHLRVHCASAVYFFVLLPAWLCGYMTDRVGARVISRILDAVASGYDSLKSLLPMASERLGPLPAAKIENLYWRTVNWSLSGPCEEEMPRDFAKCCFFFARIRFHVLRRAGWRGWSKHVPLCLADIFKGLLLGVVIRGRGIKNLKVVRRLVGC